MRPVTSDRWDDLAALLGTKGAPPGCWCMWWRQSAADSERNSADQNREAMRAIVREGPAPGLLAYVDGQPAGWCSVAPRASLVRLERSTRFRRVDDDPVWSITCFFVARARRGQGVGRRLLAGALAHTAEAGARIVEAYPVDRPGHQADASVYMGTMELFRAAGFEEVARRTPTRPIVRRRV